MVAASADAGDGREVSVLALTLFLGMLTAIGPLAIDMYLPSFPALAVDLSTSLASVERTLAVYFIGLAVGQLFYGPISDRFGRKGPLYVGLGLFVLASAGCALADTVNTLVAVRFCQALGGCALMVIARAVVRDHFGERESARVFSLLILVMGVAPILAPLLGGWLAVHMGWRSIFWFQAGVGVACLLVTRGFFAESLPRHRRRPVSMRIIGRTYWQLLRDRRFVAHSLTGGFVLAGFFAYVGGSPLVFIELHGVPTEYFGLYFGSNAAGFIVASQVNGWLMRRVDPRRSLRLGACFAATAGLALLTTVVLDLGGFAGVLVPLFCFIASIGFIAPTATALALAPHGEHAGNASAVMGFLQFGVSALGGLLVSYLQDGTAVPMAGLIAMGGVMALAVNVMGARGTSTGMLEPAVVED